MFSLIRFVSEFIGLFSLEHPCVKISESQSQLSFQLNYSVFGSDFLWIRGTFAFDRLFCGFKMAFGGFYVDYRLSGSSFRVTWN